MKLKPFKLIPALIASSVIGVVCLLRLLNLDGFERLELMSYDMRARAALPSANTGRAVNGLKSAIAAIGIATFLSLARHGRVTGPASKPT